MPCTFYVITSLFLHPYAQQADIVRPELRGCFTCYPTRLFCSIVTEAARWKRGGLFSLFAFLVFWQFSLCESLYEKGRVWMPIWPSNWCVGYKKVLCSCFAMVLSMIIEKWHQFGQIMRWAAYANVLPWLLVIVKVASGKNKESGDLIPIPDHLKDQYNNRHLVDELSSGDIDYDEYIDLELEKHKGKAHLWLAKKFAFFWPNWWKYFANWRCWIFCAIRFSV